MNDNIKTLMNAAGLQPYYDGQEQQIEKFAQLLIEKCCKIVDIWSDESADEGYDIFTVHQVKNHFGMVE